MPRLSGSPLFVRFIRLAGILAAWALSLHLASAADYFVAPDGKDANAGSKEAPFATLMRAQKAVSPGDTVFLRGGTYRPVESDIADRNGFLASIVLLDKSGTADKPITYVASPGEHPIFDCSQVKPPGLRISAFRVAGSWIRIKGIEVTGVQVTNHDHTQSICFENFGNHNIYEQLAMHDGQAIGLFINRGSDNLVLNCDAWRNHDTTSENGRGGNTDGFGSHVARRGANNIFRGCRAWLNSDDGFDCISSGSSVTFENCWSFLNGYSPDHKRLADGNGFKAGGYGVEPNTRFPDPIPRHRVLHCLAYRNGASGFYANHHPGGIDFIGNVAIRNHVNFNFLCRSADGQSDIPGNDHTIIDNISIGGDRGVTNLDAVLCQLSGNSFPDDKDPAPKRETIDLDESMLTAPRKADGSLPDIRLPGTGQTGAAKTAGIPNANAG